MRSDGIELAHFDEAGSARMVDVSQKEVTFRTAVVEGRVTMRPATLALVRDRKLAKGDVLQVARIAGVMAAKKTPDLVPLCHPIPLDTVEIDFDFEGDETLLVRARTKARSRTGVEMEALSAAMVAGLTVYDMCKAVDRAMTIGPFYLVEKTGGKSGHFKRQEG
jgi:cyclic pyranopterin phosphate synthase